jgi:hypothetical protein
MCPNTANSIRIICNQKKQAYNKLMAKIKLTSKTGKLTGIVLFDDRNVFKLFNYRWSLNRINSRTIYVSARTGRTGKGIRMHNILMPPKKGLVVDHINGNGLDNRMANLRYCTHAENLRKRPPQNGKKI